MLMIAARRKRLGFKATRKRAHSHIGSSVGTPTPDHPRHNRVLLMSFVYRVDLESFKRGR